MRPTCRNQGAEPRAAQRKALDCINVGQKLGFEFYYSAPFPGHKNLSDFLYFPLVFIINNFQI